MKFRKVLKPKPPIVLTMKIKGIWKISLPCMAYHCGYKKVTNYSLSLYEPWPKLFLKNLIKSTDPTPCHKLNVIIIGTNSVTHYYELLALIQSFITNHLYIKKINFDLIFVVDIVGKLRRKRSSSVNNLLVTEGFCTWNQI